VELIFENIKIELRKFMVLGFQNVVCELYSGGSWFNWDYKL
jgi:hypothetical protein